VTILVRATISLDRRVAFSISSVPDGDASIGIVIIRGEKNSLKNDEGDGDEWLRHSGQTLETFESGL
jgi:hypothetical protein